MLRSTKVVMTGFEPTSHTTVGRVGYPLNHLNDGVRRIQVGQGFATRNRDGMVKKGYGKKSGMERVGK